MTWDKPNEWDVEAAKGRRDKAIAEIEKRLARLERYRTALEKIRDHHIHSAVDAASMKAIAREALGMPMIGEPVEEQDQ